MGWRKGDGSSRGVAEALVVGRVVCTTRTRFFFFFFFGVLLLLLFLPPLPPASPVLPPSFLFSPPSSSSLGRFGPGVRGLGLGLRVRAFCAAIYCRRESVNIEKWD